MKSKDKPKNVLDSGLVGHIKSHKEEILTEEEVAIIPAKIETNRLARGFETNRNHVAHVKSITEQKANRS